MKKILFVLIAFLALNIFIPEVSVAGDFGAGLWDMVSGAGAVPDGEFLLPCPNEFNEIGQYASARTYIIKVINFALSFLGLISMAFVIYAGFLYVTAGGDDGQHEKAKKIVIYASVGILVVLVSFALVNTLIRHTPKGTDDRQDSEMMNYSGEGTTVPDYCKQIGEGESVEVTPVDINVSGGASFEGGSMVSLAQGQAGITFTAPKSGEWNFGDGMTGSGSSVTHRYGERGAYEVYFIAEDAEEEGVFYGAKVIVIVDGVITNFRADKDEVIANEIVQLNGGASKSVLGSIVGYSWSCTDCAQEREITTSFPNAGTYDVTLTVTNNIGATGTATKTFTVAGDKPTAVIHSIVSTGKEGQPAEYEFDAAGSANVFGTPVGLKYVWNFGDGTGEHTYNSQIVTYEYSEPGDKTVSLKVRYSYKGQTLESEPAVQNIASVKTLWADFQVPSFLTVGQEYLFKASSSSDTTYEWTFSDEATTLDPDDFPEVRAFFGSSGTYGIVLVATKGSETETITKSVFVREESEPVAIIQNDNVDVPMTLTARRNATGFTELTLKSNSIDEAGNQGCVTAQLSYNWSVAGVPVSTDCDPSESINALLREAKSYPITLTIYRPGNQNIKTSTTFTVQVENVPPVFTQLVDYGVNDNPETLPEGPVSFAVTANAEDQDTNDTISSYKFEALEGGQVKDVQILETGESYFDLSQYNGTHAFSFRATATDSDGGTTVSNGTGTYTFENEIPNEAPFIDSDLSITNGNGIFAGEIASFTVTARDPEGEDMTYKWMVTASEGEPVVYERTTGSYDHLFDTAGTYSVQVVISDGVNEVTSQVVPVHVAAIPNNPPQAGQLQIGGSSTKPLGSAFIFEAEATDPDGDDLSYAWTAKNSTTFVTTSMVSETSIATFTPTVAGSYEITVAISDLDEEGNIKDTIERTKTIWVTTVNPPDNEPPEIKSSLKADKPEMTLGEEVAFDVVVEDKEEAELSYEWTLTGPGAYFLKKDTTANNYTHTFPETGTFYVRVEISDGVNEIQSGPITVRVVE